MKCTCGKIEKVDLVGLRLSIRLEDGSTHYTAESGQDCQSSVETAPYGFCPICGGECEKRREAAGIDMCINGHCYPSKEATNVPSKPSVKEPATVEKPSPETRTPEAGAQLCKKCGHVSVPRRAPDLDGWMCGHGDCTYPTILTPQPSRTVDDAEKGKADTELATTLEGCRADMDAALASITGYVVAARMAKLKSDLAEAIALAEEYRQKIPTMSIKLIKKK